jgi:transcriptional regulator with XRE-family HTH domain
MQFEEQLPVDPGRVKDSRDSIPVSGQNDECLRAAENVFDPSDSRPSHRLAAVRRQQGVSLKNMARRLGIDIAAVQQQEQATADLPLSTIYAWQKVLDVPVAELLVDSNDPLSPPVHERARMVKLMKTAAAIVERARSQSVRRLAAQLIEQLVAIMPELREVTAWNTVGQRRTLDEYGRAFERQLPDDFSAR